MCAFSIYMFRKILHCLVCGLLVTGQDSDIKQKAKATFDKIASCLTARRNGDLVKRALTLPPDAEDHYKSLLVKTEKFRNIKVHEAHGFNGPWIENLFIDRFMSKPFSYFNGFVPLFVQWVDIHCHEFEEKKNASYPEHRHLPQLISELLRPDIIYLAVSQDDQGIGTKLTTDHPNILVISAGGYGHVPIPLIKGELDHTMPPQKYKRDVGFYGNVRPRLSRSQMLDEMRSSVGREHMSCEFAQRDSWVQDIMDTKFNLAPRGFGRTSYRLAEIIQLGRVPVYLYDDKEWLPYMGSNISVTEIGFSGGMGRLGVLAKRLKETKDDEFHKLESKVALAREHYTLEGTIKQIEKFIADPFGPQGGELRCTQVPDKDHRRAYEIDDYAANSYMQP